MKKAYALALLVTLLLTQAVASVALCVCDSQKATAACQCPDGNGCCGKQQSDCQTTSIDVHPDAIYVAFAFVCDATPLLPTAFDESLLLFENEIAHAVQKHPPRIRTPDLTNDPLRGPPSLA